MTERTTGIASAPSPADPGSSEPRTHSRLVRQLRELAACLDPAHADVFSTMPASTWRAGAEVAARLLLEHRIYLLHLHAGNGHIHRRTHARAVSVLLNAATGPDIAAGLAWLMMAAQVLNDDFQNEV